MAEEAKIERNRQVRFSVKTEFGEFNDAIYFSDDEYAKLTDEDLNAMIAARAEGFVSAIKNRPPAPDPIVMAEAEAAFILRKFEDLHRSLVTGDLANAEALNDVRAKFIAAKSVLNPDDPKKE